MGPRNTLASFHCVVRRAGRDAPSRIDAAGAPALSALLVPISKERRRGALAAQARCAPRVREDLVRVDGAPPKSISNGSSRISRLLRTAIVRRCEKGRSGNEQSRHACPPCDEARRDLVCRFGLRARGGEAVSRVVAGANQSNAGTQGAAYE